MAPGSQLCICALGWLLMTGSPSPGKPTLYLCIGMIVKSSFVFVNLLQLFATSSHGPGKSTLYLCTRLVVNDWQS